MSDYSNEVLVGFIEEVRGYLPIILENTALFAEGSGDNLPELIEEAYRHAHTIKGAAAMIGISPLSHIAYYLEEILIDVVSGQFAVENAMDYIGLSVDIIDRYLDGVINNTTDSAALLIEATRGNNTLRGLSTDDSAVAQIMNDSAEVEREEAAAAELEELMALETMPANEQSFSNDQTSDNEQASAMLMFDEEFMAELREAFQEEAEDHLNNTARLLNYLDKNPGDKAQLRELQRVIHTLKGASATVGLNDMAQLTHRMEDILDHIDKIGADVSRPVMDLLFDSADTLEDQLQADVPASHLETLLSRYDSVLANNKPATEQLPTLQLDNLPVVKEVVASAEIAAPAQSENEPEPAIAVPTPQVVVDEAAVPSPIRATSEVVRVPLERLDELVRLTSEFVITRTTLEQRVNDLTRYINEISPSLERLHRISNRLDTDYQELSYASQNAAIVNGQPVAFTGVTTGNNSGIPKSFSSEFDALEFDRYTELYELSRDLSETTSDIKTVHSYLRSLLSDFDSILTRQSRVSSEVQDKLMRTRMVPLSTIVTRLQRTVRVAARKKNKQVDLIIEGEQIELDKKVLETIADPLLHLLRNSVDHGIEPSELRLVTGKPERGTIRIRAFYEGSQIVLQIIDDGSGINIDKVRSKAISRGYLTQAEAETIPVEDLRQLIFQPGFSTAEEITDVSGRGIGMDVVKTSVSRLKGTINLGCQPGESTSITIRLPLTLAVTRALLVKTQGVEYALPLSSVAQILRLDSDDVAQIGFNPIIHVDNQVLPLVQLSELLGMPPADISDRKRLPVLLIKTGHEQIAMSVDEILEGREVVIKTLGNHLRHVHGITGATLMGDGRVVLILNPPELVNAPTLQQARQWTPSNHTPSTTPKAKVLDVLVVDDSVSVRKVVANMVKHAGWQPQMARDGLEALEAIQSAIAPPDIILLDIEMPRMNGFELTATLRANEAYKDIPIVMLTSRASAKHRAKAFDLGVNDYLVKPYREEDLLMAVRRVTHLEE